MSHKKDYVFVNLSVRKSTFRVRIKEDEMCKKGIEDVVREKFRAYGINNADQFTIKTCHYVLNDKERYYDVPINSADAVKDMCEDPQNHTIFLKNH